MKALNKKERNSAIFRFSLWLLISVLLICVPVIISLYMPGEQQKIQAGENENLMEEINFEKEYIAVNIQKIMGLMKSKEANKINTDSFNAELMNIITDVKKQTEQLTDWRGEMYRNITAISEYLISAHKIISSSGDQKDKLLSELNKVIIEFESCGESIAGLNDERKRKDIQKGIEEVEKQYKLAMKMLNSYKAGIK